MSAVIHLCSFQLSPSKECFGLPKELGPWYSLCLPYVGTRKGKIPLCSLGVMILSVCVIPKPRLYNFVQGDGMERKLALWVFRETYSVSNQLEHEVAENSGRVLSTE